jgi:hypothetical protein
VTRSPGAKREEGTVLVLVVIMLTALLGLGMLIRSQIDASLEGRKADAGRIQAIWLARSAAALARDGEQRVPVKEGNARVRVTISQIPAGRRVRSEATVPGGGTARVDAVIAADGSRLSWTERFDAPPR